MAVPVDVYVNDTLDDPISGVVVAVLDSVTTAEVATATTDGSGKAAFLLPGSGPGIEYSVRFYKLGVRFPNPRTISVLEPATSPNVFEVEGDALTIPAATDPRICRCTGRFMSMAGTPLVGQLVQVSQLHAPNEEVPKVVDANIVAQQVEIKHTDANGFVTFDLYRTGIYVVMYAGNEDQTWVILVPDQARWNLIDLIHPYPTRIEWDDVSVAVGESIVTDVNLKFSDDDEENTDLSKWLTLEFDASKVEACLTGTGTISITGREAGTHTVVAKLRPDLKPARVLGYGNLSPALTVTVTP